MLRLNNTLFIVVFSFALSSCSSHDTVKKATLACWMQFIELGKRQQTNLGSNPTGKQVAAAYLAYGGQLANLPALNVEPDLMHLIGRFSRDFTELGIVYDRISTRDEDIGYSIRKIGESFLRGLMFDPFGAAKEEMAAINKDKAKLNEVKERLEKNLTDLSGLRFTLTAKYGVEFPPLQ
jgi:hypothetical protein